VHAGDRQPITSAATIRNQRIRRRFAPTSGVKNSQSATSDAVTAMTIDSANSAGV